MLSSLTSITRRFLFREKRVTQKDAVEVAEALLRHPCIKGIELFGSLARNGVGNDIDIILIVSEELSQKFLRYVRMQSTFTGAYAYGRRKRGPASIRRSLALSVLYEQESAYDLAGLSFGRLATKIDIFLFPEDWRERAEEIQRTIPLWDPDFVSNLARDTRTFNAIEGAFL